MYYITTLSVTMREALQRNAMEAPVRWYLKVLSWEADILILLTKPQQFHFKVSSRMFTAELVVKKNIKTSSLFMIIGPDKQMFNCAMEYYIGGKNE